MGWGKLISLGPTLGLRGKVVLCAFLLGLVPVTLGTLAVFELAAGRLARDAQDKLRVLTESAVSAAVERQTRLAEAARELSHPPQPAAGVLEWTVTPVSGTSARDWQVERVEHTPKGTLATLTGPLHDAGGQLGGRYRAVVRADWLRAPLVRSEVLNTTAVLLTGPGSQVLGPELTHGQPLRLQDLRAHPMRLSGPTLVDLTAAGRDWVVCLHPVPRGVLLGEPWWVAATTPAATIEAGRGALTYKSLAVGVVFLMLLVVASFLLTDRVVGPIRRLIGRIQSEAPAVQMDTSGDEIRALDRALEQLIAVQRQDHATLSNRQEFLNGVLAQSAELDKLKDAFLSSVSHELRTPITCVKSYAEILSTYDDLDGSERQEFLGIILHESDRLARLINDLLDLSKLEAGRMPMRMERLDLQAIVASALRTLEVLAQRGEIRLVQAIPEGTHVLADRDRLTQVLLNLLGNAFKFTPPHGSVRIECEAVAGQIETRILDTGPGVPEEHLERVFEKFFQVQQEDGSDRPKGTGLGLPICREIVTRLGGEIGVRRGVPTGSVFWFRLPTVHKDVPEPPVRPAPGASEKLAELFSASR
jgi:signal transduction histidine kinase